jgi:hypothetical protein
VQLKSGSSPRALPAAAAGLNTAVAIRGAERGGEPLPAGVRALFEPRFGQDFSHVRVHVDPGATSALRARAFTSGRDIVFGAGEYSPNSAEGRRLLAHELAHVVQQTSGTVRDGLSSPGDASEREADVAAEAAMSGRAAPLTGGGMAVQRQGGHGIDAQAEALIALAQNAATPIDQRGKELVAQMLAAYYPNDAAKFKAIKYIAATQGVLADCPASGPASMTCKLEVGSYFVEHTTKREISHRVLQLGHEIQHVEQHRQGMGGDAHRHEREFLAFHWEATAPEKAGTGHLQHSTRVMVIDAALGHYNCLTAAEKASYDSRYKQLLTLRQSEQTASHQPATRAPTGCAG